MRQAMVRGVEPHPIRAVRLSAPPAANVGAVGASDKLTGGITG